jgi:hypothetical protein
MPRQWRREAAAHFGNSYEVLGPNEMRQIIAEAKFWGFNRYGDWFDTDDCKDPFASGHTYGLGDALWNAKRLNYGSAQNLGLLRDLVITPNHVYVDQCLPGLLATKDAEEDSQQELARTAMGTEAATLRHPWGDRPRGTVDAGAAGHRGTILGRTGAVAAGSLGPRASAPHLRPPFHALALVRELGQVQGRAGAGNRTGPIAVSCGPPARRLKSAS